MSSGRGDGADDLKRRDQPEALVGVDLSSRAVSFYNRHYSVAGLSFVQGDAEALGFADQALDSVLNSEAAYCLYADMRTVDELPAWQWQLSHLKLEWLLDEDTTPHVVQALAALRDRRMALVRRYVPRPPQGAFAHLTGVTGAGLAQASPRRAERVYRNYVVRAAQVAA